MGLDTSHGAWHGAYSAFYRWRCKIAEVAGLPPLELMEGYYGDDSLYFGRVDPVYEHRRQQIVDQLPIRWKALKPSPLHVLLHHSDCDGEISPEDCGPLADALEELIPLLPEEPDGGHIGDWRGTTRQFVDGLRAAAEEGVPLDFH